MAKIIFYDRASADWHQFRPAIMAETLSGLGQKVLLIDGVPYSKNETSFLTQKFGKSYGLFDVLQKMVEALSPHSPQTINQAKQHISFDDKTISDFGGRQVTYLVNEMVFLPAGCFDMDKKKSPDMFFIGVLFAEWLCKQDFDYIVIDSHQSAPFELFWACIVAEIVIVEDFGLCRRNVRDAQSEIYAWEYRGETVKNRDRRYDPLQRPWILLPIICHERGFWAWPGESFWADILFYWLKAIATIYELEDGEIDKEIVMQYLREFNSGKIMSFSTKNFVEKFILPPSSIFHFFPLKDSEI